MFFYALTIFSGAVLLFLVEPMIARYILPWFGGGPSVWSTCMLFYQLFLLGGYAYAHYIGTRLRPRRQAQVHLALLLVSLAFLPITPGEHWKPLDPAHPEIHIILLLVVTIGLPFALLSSASPLHQYWFTRACPGRSPYRLYSLSNIGSVLGLLVYPLVLEPFLTLRAQTLFWSAAYGFFILTSGWCALRLLRQPSAGEAPVAAADDAAGPEPDAAGRWRPLLWILLPACGSVMLLATTNQMCQEVAVIPFLWIVPLAVYLFSFILCFDNERWYNRYFWGLVLLLATGASLWLFSGGKTIHVAYQIGIMALALLACCMVCHGELARLKPPARRLTAFYLMISVGGAVGGLFVNFAAPRIFSGFWEYHIGLLLTFVLFGLLVARGRAAGRGGWRQWALAAIPGLVLGALLIYVLHRYPPAYAGRQEHLARYLGLCAGVALVLAPALVLLAASILRGRRMLQSAWGLRSFRLLWLEALIPLCFYLAADIKARKVNAIATSRNFYGVLRVTQAGKGGNELRTLYHGPIEHGNQFMDAVRRKQATTYYGPESGVNLACRYHPRRIANATASGQPGGLAIGVVGLGAGTSAAMAGPGDTIRFYEINPEIERIARDYFFYLNDCKGKNAVVLGDARISLEQELRQQGSNGFDVLALDAFNGDAIPIHLLTREAFAMYWKHMREGGIIAIDISNRHLDLEPVVQALAAAVGKQMIMISNEEDGSRGTDAADWALITSNQQFLSNPVIKEKINTGRDTSRTILWTDQYSNLLRVMNSVPLPGFLSKGQDEDEEEDLDEESQSEGPDADGRD